MKKVILILCLVATFGFTACDNGLSKEQIANDQMREIMQSLDAIGLSVAVVKESKLVYTGSLGFKNLEEGTLIGTDDLFRIASVSKSFTATAIMQLYEQGKFGLDDDVSDAFGMVVRNPGYPDIPITYRMLLSHRSSLNDTTGYFSYNVIDSQNNPEYWRAYNNYAPGTQYEYCNLGFNLLGALVEVHSGERFDHYIDNHIVKPLNLTGGFNVDELDRAQFVTLYDFRDGEPFTSPEAYRSRGAQLENYTLGRGAVIFSPTGGMKIAPKDLAKHMLVQINGGLCDGVQILQPQSVALMQTPYLNQSSPYSNQIPHVEPDPATLSPTRSGLLDGDYYGFALATTDKLIEGETLIGHTGSSYGLYSAMFFSPQKKFGIIMMTNGYPTQRDENDFITIQVDVIRALYDIFIKGGK